MKTFNIRLKIYAIVFIIANVCFVNATLAQITPTPGKIKIGELGRPFLHEEIKEGEFTIRIIPVAENTLGFDILKNGQLLMHCLNSPFITARPNMGLKTKADVLKVSRWMIAESRKKGHFPPPMLPPHMAKELQITVEP